LLAAAVVAAQLVLAARAASATVEQDREQPAKNWNYDRRYDHKDVVLYDTAVRLVRGVGAQARHKIDVSVHGLAEKCEGLVFANAAKKVWVGGTEQRHMSRRDVRVEIEVALADTFGDRPYKLRAVPAARASKGMCCGAKQTTYAFAASGAEGALNSFDSRVWSDNGAAEAQATKTAITKKRMLREPVI
jgi:hypothetical protein